MKRMFQLLLYTSASKLSAIKENKDCTAAPFFFFFFFGLDLNTKNVIHNAYNYFGSRASNAGYD